jgi:hypothetical protein
MTELLLVSSEVTSELCYIASVFWRQQSSYAWQRWHLRGNSRVMLSHIGVLEIASEWCLATSAF